MIPQMLEALETESLSNSLSADKLAQLRGFVESSLLEMLLRELEKYQAGALGRIPAATAFDEAKKKFGVIQAQRLTLLELADDVKTILQAKE